MLRQVMHEFAERFQSEHGLSLKFTEEAADFIATEAASTSRTGRAEGAERFKDFQFGLKLIAQNTGKSEFLIGRAVVEAPDKTLSEWVVASYGKSKSSQPGS